MQQVHIPPTSLDVLTEVLEPAQSAALREAALRARAALAGRVVWNVNATATGGGVAEMLQTLLAYCRGAGIDTRWVVIDGDAEFFAITKRLHNALHGSAGDGGPLGEDEHRHYEKVLAGNFASIATRIHPGDVVMVHDPQPAGLLDGLRHAGARVVWRCHVGRDSTNHCTDRGWAFLRRYLRNVDAFVFSRRQYAPDWVPPDRLRVIAPSIDPLSAKNRQLQPDDVDRILHRAALIAGEDTGTPVTFTRRDGSSGTIRRHHDLLLGGAPPPARAQLVLQVSRWDRLKDMAGVLTGFTSHLAQLPADAHLMLVGPVVSGVSDDPEGAGVLSECRSLRRALPPAVRDRTHLACLPTDDVEENAIIVNALQRRADVVVQKSLVEGFGLTVTEAMWKGRPVLATAAGGIADQIVDMVDGLLLDDPHDLDAFAAALSRLLQDHALAARLGTAARSHVKHQFLGDRHLSQYALLIAHLAT